MDIIGSIEADTGCDGNKYQFVEQTESYRLMRGAWEAYYEYIPELHTEFKRNDASASDIFY